MNKYEDDLKKVRAEVWYMVWTISLNSKSAAESAAWAAGEVRNSAIWAAKSSRTATSLYPVELRFQIDLVMELL